MLRQRGFRYTLCSTLCRRSLVEYEHSWAAARSPRRCGGPGRSAGRHQARIRLSIYRNMRWP